MVSYTKHQPMQTNHFVPQQEDTVSSGSLREHIPPGVSPNMVTRQNHFPPLFSEVEFQAVCFDLEPVEPGKVKEVEQIPVIETETPTSYHTPGGLETVIKDWITCTLCNYTFNNTVICINYTIKFNQPIQCACGCVVCTMCHSALDPTKTCHAHGVKIKNGIVNTTANKCAHWYHIRTKDAEWDLKLDVNAKFKTKAEVDQNIQSITQTETGPSLDELEHAFTSRLTAKDEMAFKYHSNSPIPTLDAYRYVCIPHTYCFWDHVAVANHKPETHKMLLPDAHLPKLFNVTMGSYTFHWCCFVFTNQVILAMWCTDKDSNTPKSLTDNGLALLTESHEFRLMIYYLCRWIEAHYGQCELGVNVVLDSAPCEMLPFVDLITWIAAKSGLKTAIPMNADRHHKDIKYINPRNASTLFMYPSLMDDTADLTDIESMFSAHHHTCAQSDMLTSSGRYIFM